VGYYLRVINEGRKLMKKNTKWMLSFAQHPKLFYSLILVEAFFFSSCGLNLYTNGLSASAIAKTLVLSGPSSASGAACAGPMIITNQDGHGIALSVVGNTSLILSAGGSGNFYLDSACTNSVNNSTNPATIPNASSSVNVYFKDASTESLTLSASASGFTSGTLALNSNTIQHYANDVKGENSNGNSANVVLTVAPTHAGSLLIVGVSWSAGAAVPIITDNKGDTYQLSGSGIQDGIGDFIGLFYSVNASAGVTTVTGAEGAGSTYLALMFAEFSGAKTVSPADGSVSAVSMGTTIADSGNLTPTQSGDILIAVSLDDGDSNPGSAGAGFNLITSGYGATATVMGLMLEYQVYNSMAPVRGKFTYAVSANLPIIMSAFKVQ